MNTKSPKSNDLGLKPLQSGGFADVVLNQLTGMCYKIFHYKGAEEHEFKVVRSLKESYAKNKQNTNYSSRVMKYFNFGHISKDLAREMFLVIHENNPNKFSEIMANYNDEMYVPYVSMEYVNGIDGVELGMKTKITENMAALLMHSLLLSLEELHSMGFIHRDIKPDNFMVFRNKQGMLEVKLIDLGLAVPIVSAASLNQVHGTKYYSAPETVPSVYSDLFSVAMSFYRLCGSPKVMNSPFCQLLLQLTAYETVSRGSVREAIDSLELILKRVNE